MNQTKDQAELVNRIMSGARWAVIFRLTGQTFVWLSTIIIVRFVSPDDYGLSAMLEAPLELLMLASTVGLDMALVRFKKIELNELRCVFGWLLIINSLLFLAYFFGGAFLTSYFNEPRLNMLAKTLACIFLLVPFRVIPNALLDRELKFKLRAFVEMISNLIAAIATLILAIKGMGIWALILGILVNRIVQSVMLMILQPWMIMPSFGIAAVRRMAAFGGIMAVSGALVLLTDKLVSLIAGPSLGPEMLGIYAVALQFSLLPLTKTMPVINPLIFPSFSKLQDQPTQAAYYLEKSLGIFALGLFPTMIGMACISQEFVQTVFGEKWHAVALPLALLSLIMPFRMISSFLRPVISSMGRSDLNLVSVSLKLCILMPMILVGMDYGIIGLVIASLVTEPIATFATIHLSKRVINVSLAGIYHHLRPAITSVAVMAACVLWAKVFFGQTNTTWIILVLQVGVGVISYFLVLKFIFPNQIYNAYKLVIGK